jgi:predicted phosphodiesterase
MRIFITGDTHGASDYGFEKLTSQKFQEGRTLTKNDYVIITGDFGLLWDPANRITKEEKYHTKWLTDRPWTTLFVDGNHDNFDRIDALETVEMFGAEVGKVNDSIFHLRRGFIYNINGRTFFVMGGGDSIDKASRMPGVSWWERELPNYTEMSRGLTNLDAVSRKVDYILAHDCPSSLLDDMVSHHDTPYQLTRYLQEVVDTTEFKHFFFGHHHRDITLYGKYTCSYRKVIEIA